MEPITLDYQELATGHYKSLLSAFGVAFTRAKKWDRNGETVTAAELFHMAQGQGPLEAPDFYVVSCEGAIGVCSGKEYQVRWLLIPMVNESLNERIRQEQEALARQEAEERARREAEERVQLEAQERARREAEERAHREAEAAKAAQAATAAAAAAAATALAEPVAPARSLPKFCPNCGTPYKSDASRFCTNCGTPRKM